MTSPIRVTKYWLYSFLFALALALSLVHSATSAQTQPMGPALWKIENENTQVFIFGTFHMLTEEANWAPERIFAISDHADTLTLETTSQQTDPNLIAFITRQRAQYGPFDSIKRNLPRELYSDLAAYATANGLPMETLDDFRPWYAATTVALHDAYRNGFMPEHGVDAILEQRAIQRGIPVLGLELAHDQIAAMADQSKSDQIGMLRQVLDDVVRMEYEYELLISSWLNGDEAAMEHYFLKDTRQFPKLYNSLYVERNQNWLPQIIELTQTDGVHFVAVGAAHLVGEDSLITLLREQGITVARAQ